MGRARSVVVAVDVYYSLCIQIQTCRKTRAGPHRCDRQITFFEGVCRVWGRRCMCC